MNENLILAPLRGVTIRTFRKVFARAIQEANFTEAITPFISATDGLNPLHDRELRGATPFENSLLITPQFITNNKNAFRECLKKIKEAGYKTADLNAGCPYPMIRNKGRGSGLLKNKELFLSLISIGCEIMGENNFSVKTRLGINKNDELKAFFPELNNFPLRFLTIHARNAKQMYDGACDYDALNEIKNISKIKIISNGDITLENNEGDVMIGRSFIKSLATRNDIEELLDAYVEASKEELYGEKPVLGRIKELLAYWKDIPLWSRRWQIAKQARNLNELRVW